MLVVRIAALVAAGCLIGPGVQAAIVVGGPPDAGGNQFPFGGIGTPPSDRYQQVYSSAEFSGVLKIDTIQFFQTVEPGGNLNGGTYTVRLSTTTKAVNGLNLLDFDDNVGSDVAIFSTTNLSSAQTSSGLEFTTATPFAYDSSLGNLLIDILIADGLNVNPSAFFDSRNGTADGVMSSAHNFTLIGSGDFFTDYGLVTLFSPEPSSGALVALGMIVLGARSRRTAAR